MNVPQDLRYTKEHEWVKKIDNHTAVVGITDFAQSELGDLVYIEVETVGEQLEKDEVFGTVEAVKTTSDLFMPVSGKIVDFNPELDENQGDNPGLINEDPYGKGWIIKIELSNLSELEELMDDQEYKNVIE